MITDENGYVVVPWPITKYGDEVTTCGNDEDALGLSQLICGWGKMGFYTQKEYVNNGFGPGVTRQETYDKLVSQINSIDWNRVEFVKSTYDYDIPGVITVASFPTKIISLRRYQRLLRHCFKSISQEKFKFELAQANKFVKYTSS